MRQASSSSSPALNFASTSAAASGAARISEKNSATKEKARYFKVRLLGEVFEIALDLLFHLRRNALLEGLEDLFAEVAWRLVIFFTGKAEFLGVQSGKAAVDVKLGELRHAGQRHEHAAGQKAALAEEPGDGHVAELSALGHLLHGGLHLLLRLCQALQRAPFRRHGAGGIELPQPVLAGGPHGGPRRPPAVGSRAVWGGGG